MRKWICLNCKEEHWAHTACEHENITVDGKSILVSQLKARCPCCGEYMENDEVTDINLQIIKIYLQMQNGK